MHSSKINADFPENFKFTVRGEFDLDSIQEQIRQHIKNHKDKFTIIDNGYKYDFDVGANFQQAPSAKLLYKERIRPLILLSEEKRTEHNNYIMRILASLKQSLYLPTQKFVFIFDFNYLCSTNNFVVVDMGDIDDDYFAQIRNCFSDSRLLEIIAMFDHIKKMNKDNKIIILSKYKEDSIRSFFMRNLEYLGIPNTNIFGMNTNKYKAYQDFIEEKYKNPDYIKFIDIVKTRVNSFGIILWHYNEFILKYINERITYKDETYKKYFIEFRNEYERLVSESEKENLLKIKAEYHDSRLVYFPKGYELSENYEAIKQFSLDNKIIFVWASPSSDWRYNYMVCDAYTAMLEAIDYKHDNQKSPYKGQYNFGSLLQYIPS